MDKKEILSKVKEDMLQFSCEQNGHQYGFWKKNENGYERECQKCQFKRIIKSAEPEQNIENEIQKQKEGENLLNFFYQENNNNLDNENILFYIYAIKDYLNYIDLNKLQIRINELNKPLIESLEEYRIISMFSQNINNVPEELWLEIKTYIENIMNTKEKAHH